MAGAGSHNTNEITSRSVRGALDEIALRAKFAVFRHLVPLTTKAETTHLNAAYRPPSNYVVHDAITNYTLAALHDPSPTAAWQAAAAETRKLIGRYINADPSSIAFTRNTTEGVGIFIRCLRFKPGDNIVMLDTEHPSQAYGWMALQEHGLEVRQVPTLKEVERTNKVEAATAETIAPFVDDRTRAIGLSAIMFESGLWNDIAGICAVFRPKGIHVLVDLTQQVGFAAVDVKALGVSAAALSLHKGMNCPTGLGCLYVEPETLATLDPVPPIVGYGAVQNASDDLLVRKEEPNVFHPSAQRFEHKNVCLVAAVAAKAYLTFFLDTMGPCDVEAYLYTLGDALRRECERLRVGIVGPSERRYHAPHLYILDLKDPAWKGHLAHHGIYVTHYRLGVRVSFGFYNSVSDVKRLAEVLERGLVNGLPAH